MSRSVVKTVCLALRGLEIVDPQQAVGYEQARQLGQQGRPKKGSNATFNSGRGRAYILARLDRDGFAELALAAFSGSKVETLKHGGDRTGQAANLPLGGKVIRVARKAASILLNVSYRSITNAAVVRDHGTPALQHEVEQRPPRGEPRR